MKIDKLPRHAEVLSKLPGVSCQSSLHLDNHHHHPSAAVAGTKVAGEWRCRFRWQRSTNSRPVAPSNPPSGSPTVAAFPGGKHPMWRGMKQQLTLRFHQHR
jgi:hypothetical protein